MDEQRSKLMTFALASGAFAIIVVGLGVALAGQWFGWLIAAFGALDAASIPFVLRVIGSRGTTSDGSGGGHPDGPDGSIAGAGNAEPAADPTTDPSYNPYARED